MNGSDISKRQAARRFVKYWTLRRGSEKGEDQQFWNSLLGEVLGIDDVKAHVQYQVPVPMAGTTKFLDAWIPETRVLIEHKSRCIDLDARAKYPGATLAQLYGDKMYLFPELVAAHEANDRAVLAAYGLAPDTPEPEIVAHLFRLYAILTEKGS